MRLIQSVLTKGAKQPQNLEKGCLDGLIADEIVGWFSTNHSPMPELVLVVDGEIYSPIAPVVCELERKDVASSCDVDALCGFRLPLSDLPAEKVSKLSVLHRASGFDFAGHTFTYCPAVFEHADVLKRLFHAEFYRFRYALETLSNDEALDHYMWLGIYEGYDPNPWFSNVHVAEQLMSLDIESEIPIITYLAHEAEKLINPSPLFDTRFYAKSNPDVIKVFGYLEHYVLHGHAEGRNRLSTVMPDHVCQELAELSAFDHDLEHAIDFVDRVVRYPLLTPQTYIPGLIKRRFPQPPAAVICVNSLNLGGAELIATYVMQAMTAHYGAERVVMIVTDSNDVTLSALLGDDANIIYLDEEGSVSGTADRIDLLHAVIGQLRPTRIININSRTAWGMYHAYGKQLSRFIELDANLFCLDYDAKGRVFGYIREFIPGCLEYLTHVMCDNQNIIDDIREHYGFIDQDMAKFHTVYIPAPEVVTPVDISQIADRGKPILWSGRLANQKRPELLIAIAESMPDTQFVVYGPPGDSETSHRISNNEIENIEYRGVYTHITDVDLSEFSLYLNTSAWEGLPTMIIQVMSAGLPVVTSSVGGISELVDETSGWVVTDDDEVDAYVTRIRERMAQPQQAQQRVIKGQAIIAERHSWDHFHARLKSIGLLEKPNGVVARNVLKFTRRLLRRAS